MINIGTMIYNDRYLILFEILYEELLAEHPLVRNNTFGKINFKKHPSSGNVQEKKGVLWPLIITSNFREGHIFTEF